MIASDEADRVQALKEGNDAHAMSATYARNCLEKPNNKECDGLRYEQLPHPPTAFVLIEYEAANAFNAKLPGFFSCRVNVRDDGKYTESSILTSTAVPEQIGKRLKSQAEFIKNASN